MPISHPDTSGTGRRLPGRILLSMVCVVILLCALKWAAPVFVPIAMAFFLAVLNFPLKEWLNRMGLHPLLSLAVVMLLNIGVVVGIGALGVSLVDAVQKRLPSYLGAIQVQIERAAVWLDEHNAGGASEAVKALDWQAIWRYAAEQGWLDSAAMAGTDAVRFVLAFGKNLLITFLLMAFILLEATQMGKRFAAIHNAGGPDLSYLMRIAGDIQKYIGIKTVIGVITAVCCGLLCWFAGLEYALFWGLVAFFLNYIPIIGAMVAAVPPTIIALVILGPGHALIIGGGYLAINQLFGSVIEPMIMGIRFGVSMLVMFLSVIVWGWLWGYAGMFLAVPLTMMLKVALDNNPDWRWLSMAMSKQELRGQDQLVSDMLRDLEQEESTLGAGASTESPRQ